MQRPSEQAGLASAGPRAKVMNSTEPQPGWRPAGCGPSRTATGGPLHRRPGWTCRRRDTARLVLPEGVGRDRVRARIPRQARQHDRVDLTSGRPQIPAIITFAALIGHQPLLLFGPAG